MKHVTKYIITGVILVALAGAVYYFWLNPKKALDFVVPSFTGVAKVEVEIKGDTAYLDAYAVMRNQAPYPISIQKLEYTIQMAGQNILSERQNLDLRQKSGEVDTMNLFVRLPYKEITYLLDSIQHQDSTTVGVAFRITYQTLFGKTSIPAEFNIPIKTPMVPKVELGRIRLGFFNFKERRFELILDMDIINENNVEVSIAELEYEAEFGENLEGEGQKEEVLTIGANTRSNVKLSVVISIDKPMEVVWKIITDKDRMEYTFNMKGKLLIDDPKQNDLPFDVTVIGDAELVK